jgi:hypothetical protein
VALCFGCRSSAKQKASRSTATTKSRAFCRCVCAHASSMFFTKLMYALSEGNKKSCFNQICHVSHTLWSVNRILPLYREIKLLDTYNCHFCIVQNSNIRYKVILAPKIKFLFFRPRFSQGFPKCRCF